MDGDTLHPEAGQATRMIIGRDGDVEGDAELVVGGAGRDLGVGAGIDVRVDPEGDGRRHAQPGGDSGEHLRLLDRFDIELAEPALKRLGHFRGGLADAREDDVLGGIPAATARRYSPIETTSPPNPCAARVASTAALGLALTAKATRGSGPAPATASRKTRACRSMVAVE